MISCTCPHCDGSIIIPFFRAGWLEKKTCPDCEAILYIHHSRWRPHVFTVAQVIVDEEAGTLAVTDEDARQEIAEDYREFAAIFEDMLAEMEWNKR